MLALSYPAKGEIDLGPRETPRPGAGEALVRVAASGICHTDIDVLHARYGPGAFPVVPGHEFAGTIEAFGEGTEEAWGVGDRVAVDPNLACGTCRPCTRGLSNLCETLGAYGVTCDGGFAQFAVVRADKLRAIGDLSFPVAALAEPLSCVLNGLAQAGLAQAGTGGIERALVIGAGPIGLLMALALRGRDVPHVALCDRDEGRLAFAESFGFPVLEADADALSRERFDLVVEATGAAQVAERAIDLAADGGTILVFGVGDPGARIAVSPFAIFRRQLRLVGSHSLIGQIDEALALLATDPDTFARLISDRVPLADIAPFLAGEAKGSMKVQFVAQP